MKMKRIAVAGAAAGLAAAAGVTAADVADALFMKVISREGVRKYKSRGDADMDKIRAPYGDAPQKGIAFLRSTPRESVTIKTSTDGLTLHGYY